MVKYKVSVNKVGFPLTNETFNSRKTALNACFLLLSVLDYPTKYSNISYLENQIKQRACTRAGVSSALKDWNLDLEKIR